MTTNWTIAVDWDGDGFFCKQAKPGDALNVYPKPPQSGQLKYDALMHTNVALGWSLVCTSAQLIPEKTNYGLLVIRTTTNTFSDSGLWLGRDAGGVNDIVVSPNTQYTLTYWIRGVSNYAGRNFAAWTLDQNDGINQLDWGFQLTSAWQKRTLTFTTTGASAYLYVGFTNASTPTAGIVFDVAGVMLVQGATAPAGFNAGNTSNLYDAVPAISANWFLGNRAPYQELADNSMLELMLDNTDKRFSPENTSSPLYYAAGAKSLVSPFKRVMIESNDGTTARTHWTGWIESVQPDVNAEGKRQVKINAHGPMYFMKEAETRLALQENQRTDQVVAALLAQVVMPPGLGAAWILEFNQNSQLGVSTFLADTAAYSILQAGISTLALAGDNWVRQGGLNGAEKDTFNVYQALWDVTAAERGRFFFNREGKGWFWNRHFLLLDNPTSVPAFTDTMTDLVYSYAGMDELKNEVVVVCHPRTLSPTSNELLWTLTDKIELGPGEARKLTAKFEDENNNRIGGRNVTVSGVTFSIGSATITLTAAANGAELEVKNASFSNPATLTACEIRGQKITDFGTLEATERDTTSIVEYGRRSLRMNLPAVDQFEEARQIALFEVQRRGKPRGMVKAMTVASHGLNGGNHHTNQLSLTVGDRVAIAESQTNHNARYDVIGEAHKLTMGATLWETTWYLQPAATTFPWRLPRHNEYPAPETGSSTYSAEQQARSKVGTTTLLTY
ncbi:hypothetical protein ANAEL_00817 [Anaerolineales bacterium]|nr:hypothetical protein ANAEL_00817 [Anaerolineales bacterium]